MPPSPTLKRVTSTFVWARITFTRMELAAEPNVFVGLESSTDLRNWRSVTNATLTEESITFLHTNSASQQFYRALPLR